MKKWVLTLFMLLIIIPSSFARRRAEVDYPKTYTHKGAIYHLQGNALKEATIFLIRVYGIGLYVPKGIHKKSQIYVQSNPVVFYLEFVRNIDAERLSDGWLKDVKKYCESNCPAIIKAVEAKRHLLPDVNKRDKMVYALSKDRVEVYLNGKLLLAITEKYVDLTILNAFIGPKANEDMREGLLGLRQREDDGGYPFFF